MNARLQGALECAEAGFAVTPVQPRGKAPFLDNWAKTGSTDPEKIRQWAELYPSCNFGVIVGEPSKGLVIIDVEEGHREGVSGREWLEDWEHEHGSLPETWTVESGGGGKHIYFCDPVHAWENCSNQDLGLEIRARDLCVVCPGSIHPETGKEYYWDVGGGDGTPLYTETEQNSRFTQLLNTIIRDKEGRQKAASGSPQPGSFQEPETIEKGSREQILIALLGSLRAKGLSDDAIRAAIRAENEARCRPPMTDKELEREIFPALKRDWQEAAPYYKQNGGEPFDPKGNLTAVKSIKAEEPRWLFPDFVPADSVFILAGDGGVGKTTVWCDMAAAVTTGRRPFFLRESDLPFDLKPGIVLAFSAEDSVKFVLKNRLARAGADMSKIYTVETSDPILQQLKIGSPEIEACYEAYKPALVIFDPIQGFVPPNLDMSRRNAMRSCISSLVSLGEKYGTATCLIIHTNKQTGVWGRRRMADSSDFWDISRSVLIAGETDEKGILYLAHEKSNYGPRQMTTLFSIDRDTGIKYEGRTEETDRDFVQKTQQGGRSRAGRDDAKDFILATLANAGGTIEGSELIEMGEAAGVSRRTLERARAELRSEGKISIHSKGKGANHRFYIQIGEKQGGEV